MNGKELYTFKHRIPLEKVSTLNISGDVAVNLSGFMQVSYFLFSSMNDIVTESSENENSLEGEELSKVTFLCSLIRTGKHLYFLQKVQQKSPNWEAHMGNFPPYKQRYCSQSKTL